MDEQMSISEEEQEKEERRIERKRKRGERHLKERNQM